MAVTTMKTVAIRSASMLGMTANGFVAFEAGTGAPSTNLSQAGRQCMPRSAGVKRDHRVHKDALAAINPAAMRAGRPVGEPGVSGRPAFAWEPSLGRWPSVLRLPLIGRSARYPSSRTTASSASSAR